MKYINLYYENINLWIIRFRKTYKYTNKIFKEPYQFNQFNL